MMVKLLLLVIPLLGAGYENEALTPEWPPAYTYEALNSFESGTTHILSSAKYYLSSEEASARVDAFDGQVTHFQIYKSINNGTYDFYWYYFTTNDTAANVMTCDFHSIPAIFPMGSLPWVDSKIYSNVIINGAPARKTRVRIPEMNGLTVTLWKQMGDRTKGPIPVRLEIEFFWPQGYTTEYQMTEYYNYQPKEPEKSVWIHPPNVECRKLDSETAEIEENLYGFLPTVNSAFSGQSPHRTKSRRARGLKANDKSLESTLPFQYTDEEIHVLAEQLPDAFDWRNHGAVTTVKDQTNYCRCSWAFGIVGAMEGAYFRKTGFLGDMSVQALVDCAWWTDPSNNKRHGGCHGGYSAQGFDWIKKHGGLPMAADYGDYKASNLRCTLNNVKTVGPIKGYVHVKADVEAVKVALYHHGPLTVSIYTPHLFDHYQSGVFKPAGMSGPADHSVLLIGYGSLNGEDYWLIKNSWSEQWGLRGYGLISTENNTMGLLDYVFYPELI